MDVCTWRRRGGAIAVAASLVLLASCGGAGAKDDQKSKQYSLGYDQPPESAYGISAKIFEEELESCSDGTIDIKPYPNAQLGSEPELLQGVMKGDLDFVFSGTANASTVSAQLGVFSLHYLIENEAQYEKVLGDPEIAQAVNDLVEDTVDGASFLGLHTLGFRDVYSDKPVHSVEDVKGWKVRVQTTKTEDEMWGAYGAQTVHMDFGEVYTALQNNLIDAAENGIGIYEVNKHYEVAPVLSLTEHVTNTMMMWESDTTRKHLTDKEQKCVEQAATKVSTEQPKLARELDAKSLASLKDLGVKVVEDVDKESFAARVRPINERVAEGLGPHAQEIYGLIEGLK